MRPLKWALESDGDGFEMTYWPVIKRLFPNYEVLWSFFITPITCRDYYERSHPLWIHPKRDVEENLQRLSQAHYTIFLSLAANWDIMSMVATPIINPNSALFTERYDIFYTNLGTIGDMTSDICFFVEALETQ